MGLYSYFDPTDPDNITIANFFFVFSRIEYALNRARFTTHQNGKAQPAWDDFADKLDEVGCRLDASPELKAAIKYLRSKPPKKQTVKNGNLSWKLLEQQNETETQWLLLLVRRVRNNLFHGGKFPEDSGGEVEEPGRDRELMKNTLIVLNACLECHSEVKAWFWEPLG